MGVFKKLVLLALATFAAVYLMIWSLDAFGFRSPLFAFLLNWIAMSWIAIAGQAVHFSLPQRYYRVRGFERTGRVYEQLGIRLFKRLVRRGPLAMFSPTLRFPKDRTISALQRLEDEIRRHHQESRFCPYLLGPCAPGGGSRCRKPGTVAPQRSNQSHGVRS